MELSQNSDCCIKKEYNAREIIDTIVVSDSEDDFLPKTPRSKRKILRKQNKTFPKKLSSQFIPFSPNPSSSCNSKVNIPKTSSKRNNKSKVSKNLHCTDFFAIKKHVNGTIKENNNVESFFNICTQENAIESSNSSISVTNKLEIDSVFNDLPSNITEIDIVEHKIKLDISDSPPENLTQIKQLFFKPSAIDTIKCETKLDTSEDCKVPFNQTHMCLTQFKPSQTTSQSIIPDYFQCSKSTKDASIILTQNEEKINADDTDKQSKRYTADSNNKLLENVLKISHWTLTNENFRNLFTEKEKDLIENLFKFPNKKCTILCLRLFPRIDKWYKLDHLCGELNLKDDEFNLQDLFQQLSADYLTSGN